MWLLCNIVENSSKNDINLCAFFYANACEQVYSNGDLDRQQWHRSKGSNFVFFETFEYHVNRVFFKIDRLILSPPPRTEVQNLIKYLITLEYKHNSCLFSSIFHAWFRVPSLFTQNVHTMKLDLLTGDRKSK